MDLNADFDFSSYPDDRTTLCSFDRGNSTNSRNLKRGPYTPLKAHVSHLAFAIVNIPNLKCVPLSSEDMKGSQHFKKGLAR